MAMVWLKLALGLGSGSGFGTLGWCQLYEHGSWTLLTLTSAVPFFCIPHPQNICGPFYLDPYPTNTQISGIVVILLSFPRIFSAKHTQFIVIANFACLGIDWI